MSSSDIPEIETPPAPQPPMPLMVRYGRMKLIGEFPFDGEDRPRCGQKVVLRTRRGTDLAEVLGSACAGECGCAGGICVPEERVETYIDASGGKDYPFTTEGRIVRVATREDIEQQRQIDGRKADYISAGRDLIRELDLPMKLVDVELLLGGEMATFYFVSEHRVDFRTLVKHLASRFHTRIQMCQVNAREEARLVADYETCGQRCCCKQFLKVLRPVSMGSAKMQKATLDPSKISGRCGRLKCCLRYEEQTYDELRKKLPKNNVRVRVKEGTGVVVETMILTQLVKIRLDENDRIIAVDNEQILERNVPESAATRPRSDYRRPDSGGTADAAPERREGSRAPASGGRRPRPDAAPSGDQSTGEAANQPRGREPREPRGPRRENAPPARTPRPAQAPEQGGNPAGAVPPAGATPSPAPESAPPPPTDPNAPAPPATPPGGQQPGIGALGRRRRRGRGREGR